MNNAQIQKTLKNLTERKEILDDWSAGFVESVQHQFETGRRLSGRQIEIIQRISSENTEEMLRLQQNFKDLWLTDGYKEKWDICISYYEQAGTYNRRSVANARRNKDYIPLLKEYKKVVENKYAQGVLESWYSEPKYPVTSLVRIRQTAPVNQRGSAGCIVIKTNVCAPRTHARGGKVYLVMPMGSTRPLEIEERHLKKFKRS